MKGNVEGRVIAVCVGPVRPLQAGGRVHQTAFVKEPVEGPVALTALGPAGDEHVFFRREHSAAVARVPRYCLPTQVVDLEIRKGAWLRLQEDLGSFAPLEDSD